MPTVSGGMGFSKRAVEIGPTLISWLKLGFTRQPARTLMYNWIPTSRYGERRFKSLPFLKPRRAIRS